MIFCNDSQKLDFYGLTFGSHFIFLDLFIFVVDRFFQSID